MKIASNKTCAYWHELKRKILDPNNRENHWQEAYDLLIERLNSRYFEQVEIIKKYGSNDGEGFAIVAIYCSIIEFLETTYQGLNFREGPKGQLKKYEYNSSMGSNLFKNFLITRKPFLVDEVVANSFYKNVRCGLLHEAQTKNGWIIRVDNAEFITVRKEGYILNRKIFQKKIEQFLYLYKKNLFEDTNLQKAFIRKFDGICSH